LNLLPRYTIATLAVIVALIAVDIAWLRIMASGHSVLGFRREGFDFGVLPMVNILAFGLYRLPARCSLKRRFLIGLECSGAAAVFAYAGCTWQYPDAVRDLAPYSSTPCGRPFSVGSQLVHHFLMQLSIGRW
jgi:hypothetical protein